MFQLRRKQTAFIRRVLYSLKRAYGFPVTFCKIEDEDLDLETGKRSPTISYIKIRKAIVLPATLQQKFEYDLAFIAANRNFTYGGFYNTSLKRIIVDARDLGSFVFEIGNYFIYEEKRWEIAQIKEFDFQTAFDIIGREVKGTPRYMVEDFRIETTLQFTQTVGVE